MSMFSFGQYRGYSLAIIATSGFLAGCGGGGGGGDSDLGRDGSGSSTIQGIMSIESGSRVDSDYADLWRVNGESWPPGSGTSVDLPIPATAAGYLSASGGTYEGTDLGYPADAADEYTVSLLEGDRYSLQCFPSDDGSVDDLDATLLLDGTPVISNTACGSGGTVPPSGHATISVSSSAGGPFRYVLTIAPQGSLRSFDARWPEPDLQVNEAVLSGPAAVTSTLSSSGQQATSVMDSMRSIGPDLWHIRRDMGVRALSTGPSASSDPRAETIEWIRTMREEFGLAVEPNYLFRHTAPTGDDEFYVSSSGEGPDNWNLDQINMSSAWSRAGDPSGQGVGVAIMDTGLLSTNLGTYGAWHEDLAANVVAEGGTLDFVSSTYDVDGTGGRDANPATPLTPDSEASTSFHGTHVAGIVAAVDNASGTIGIAYEATIMPYRVLGVDSVTGRDGVGSLSDLLDAIATAANRADQVDVINLSLGGLPQLEALQTVTDFAYGNGILVVAAGGNSGDASATYPAANWRVLGVGATDRNRDLASYSNYGQSVDLLAPGGSLDDGIVNAYGDVDGSNNISSGYAYLAGTSMAAPHVTGVYALMKDVANVTPDQFRAQLIAGNLTNTDAASLNNYDYALHGAGLLDANKAMDPGTVGQFPTVVSAWPRLLELSPSGNESQALLEVLKESTAAAPQVSGAPTVPAPFILTHGNGDPVQSGDLLDGSLNVRVDPDQVPEGRPLAEEIIITYTADSTADSGTRDLVLPVYVQATDEESQRTAGRHYVLLLDINDFGSARSQGVVADYDSGKYEYGFSEVASGDYILVAGTDLDNNGVICENGEACAEYPRAGDREIISIGSGEALQLDMTTSFRRPSLGEMGLPRYGFEGYPVPDRLTGDQPVDKQVQ
ncbi:S8 family serine peptidase [Marinobacter lacisalsi]|uniref:S8 family serine peptidase n=1 Tax=Marinobacter lacisalsi TaxID=475979 RepID=A0ABV8QFC8_9GAMM